MSQIEQDSPVDNHCVRQLLESCRLDTAEIDAIFGAIVTASTGPDGLTPVQSSVIRATTLALTGHDLDPADCRSVTPDELAEELDRQDRPDAFRHRLIRYMGLNALLLDPIPASVVATIDRYASAMGLAHACDAVVRPAGVDRQQALFTDFARNGYSREFFAGGHDGALHTGDADLGDGWSSVENDPELAARWAALAECPDGSMGRTVHDFYRSRAFVTPGLPGSAPPLLAQHDWVHVLADFGTRVSCEIEVFGMIAESDDDPRSFSLLAMVIGLFATGALDSAAGLFEADAGHLETPAMATRLADALRRGMSATKPDGTRAGGLMSIDWFAYADLSVDEMRELCNIDPKSTAAIDAGSPSTWVLEGLSDYQLEHCDLEPFDRYQPMAVE